MGAAQEGDRVRVLYEVILDDGTVFDFQENRDPLEFTIGEGEVLPLLEREVVGMEPGETKRIRVPASDITGVTLDRITTDLGVKELPAEVTNIPLGTDIGPGPNGDITTVLIPGLERAKYSLAGKDITLELKLVVIEERIEKNL